MTANERIDRVFVEDGNLTLIAGHGQHQKRLLVNTRRITEASPILGRAISDPTNHDPNNYRILVRKTSDEHTQLFLLGDNPGAWMFLCAILYPQSRWPVREVGGKNKLDAASYAVIYEMQAKVRKRWPRLNAVTTLSWPDMWRSMNACFLLEMPQEFEVLSREIIYDYQEPFDNLIAESHNMDWGVKVAAAMNDVRQSIHRSMLRIINIAGMICTEPLREEDCNSPGTPCFHQRALANELCQTETRRDIYTNMAAYTPNQIRQFWVDSFWLCNWISNAASPLTPYYPNMELAQREAEIFSRKWNSVKGPLGICLYCDAGWPIFRGKCRRRFCRAEYGIWMALNYGI